eukprot:526755_1
MTESVWEPLHVACPSCSSNHIGYWYHPGGDKCYFTENKPKEGYVVQYKIGSVVEVRCDGCKSAKNIVNWQFKCQNHDYLPFKHICHLIRFHYEGKCVSQELRERAQWNNNYFLELTAFARRNFKLNGKIEFYEDANGHKMDIDDMDDMKSAFEYRNTFEIDIYAKLKRCCIKYDQKQFYWCPRDYMNDLDDEKEPKGEYDALLDQIHKEYGLNTNDVVLETNDSAIEIANDGDLSSLWKRLTDDKEGTTCAVHVSIMEPAHALSVLTQSSLSRGVIPKKVVQDILGQNSKSLKETQDILSKIDGLNIEMKQKPSKEEHAHEADEGAKKEGEERDEEDEKDELQMKEIEDVPPDIPDEMNDLMESTKDDLCGIVKAQCHIQQTIQLLKQILKYEPVGLDEKDARKGIWNTIHKCTQDTINDMNMVLAMKRTYLSNMNKVCEFISTVDGDDQSRDLSDLHIQIDGMMQSQNEYNAKIKESTKNALATLREVIAKFVDPTKIDEINNNIRKYQALYEKEQSELNRLEQQRSVQLSPFLQRVYKNQEKKRSLRYRIYDIEKQMHWMERLKEPRRYYQSGNRTPPLCPKASPKPDEYTIRLFAEQLYNDDELGPFIDILEKNGIKYMHQVRNALDINGRNDWRRDWDCYYAGHVDMDCIMSTIKQAQLQYKPSLNCGIYGSYLHTPHFVYKPSLNSGVYGCFAMKPVPFSTITEQIKEKLSKIFEDNDTWIKYIKIWQKYYEAKEIWRPIERYCDWKRGNKDTTIEHEIVRLNELNRQLNSQLIATETEYETLDRELRQKQNEWNLKINKERANVMEYKRRFTQSSDDMNDIINRTGVKQRDIKDFLVLTKSLIPVMVNDQASTNSLSTKFECSYELIKRTLGPQPKSYKVKLFLQNTQQYAPKFDPYIDVLNENGLEYMHQVQCKTKKEFKERISTKLLIVVEKKKKKKLAIGIRRKFQSICIKCKEWQSYFEQSTGLAAQKQQQLKHCYRNFATIFATN